LIFVIPINIAIYMINWTKVCYSIMICKIVDLVHVKFEKELVKLVSMTVLYNVTMIYIIIEDLVCPNYYIKLVS